MIDLVWSRLSTTPTADHVFPAYVHKFNESLWLSESLK
jgi:hypothetical protein